MSQKLYKPLPRVAGGFRLVYADPAWDHRSNSLASPGRNPRRYYKTMSLEAIADLPVRGVVAPVSALLMWVPGQFLVKGLHLPIFKSWGFTPSSVWLTWIKTRRHLDGHSWIRGDQLSAELTIGTGHTTRKTTEFLLIGKRGRSVREVNDIIDVAFAQRLEHSAKPDAIYPIIERYSDGPYLELFARKRRKGWRSWGDQLE